MDGKMRRKEAGFKDVITPPNDHLEILVRDRDGRAIQHFRRVGEGETNTVTHLPVISRSIADLEGMKHE